MDDVSEGYQRGADCYITKPFKKAQILNGIKLVLASRPELAKDKLEAHAAAFLRACHKLSRQTERLARLFAAEEGISPSEWLYKGLEARLKTDEAQSGTLKKSLEWYYSFRGWGVEFQNIATGEQADLSIGPGGRADTFDEWRVQCYIENEARRAPEFRDLNAVIKAHSDAAKKFMEHLSSKGWIEPAPVKHDARKKELDAQLGDRWSVSSQGRKALQGT